MGAIALAARSHKDTTTEIRTLLGDLQVLGRSEFKLLLKWCGFRELQDLKIASAALFQELALSAALSRRLRLSPQNVS